MISKNIYSLLWKQSIAQEVLRWQGMGTWQRPRNLVSQLRLQSPVIDAQSYRFVN